MRKLNIRCTFNLPFALVIGTALAGCDDTDIRLLSDDHQGLSFSHVNNDNAADTDGDGLPDYLELKMGLDPHNTDSDGDGVPDGQEDSDGDGLTNLTEFELGLNPSNQRSDGSTHDSKVDTDGDGIPDYVEWNVGLNHLEMETRTGIPDYRVDSDEDGIPDYLEFLSGLDHDTSGESSDKLVDANEDGIPDYMELDSDGDGIEDYLEFEIGTNPFAWSTAEGVQDAILDTNENSVPDYAEVDTDGDGIPDYLERLVNLNPSNPQTDGITDDQMVDADGNGVPDYMEVDSDGDGINDYLELAVGTNPFTENTFTGTTDGEVDKNGNGIPDFAEIDTDGDGIPDYLELLVDLSPINPQTDGISDDTLVDVDGSGVPDYMEVDSDGDGVSDIDEINNGGSPFVAQPKATLSNVILMENDAETTDGMYQQFESLEIQYEVDTYGATFVRVEYDILPVSGFGTQIGNIDGEEVKIPPFIIDSAGEYTATLTPYYQYLGQEFAGEPKAINIPITSVRNWLRTDLESASLYSFKAAESAAAVQTNDTYIAYPNEGPYKEDAIFIDEKNTLTRAYSSYYYQTADKASLANIQSQVDNADTEPQLSENSQVIQFTSQGHQTDGTPIQADQDSVFYDGVNLYRSRLKQGDTVSTLSFFDSLAELGGEDPLGVSSYLDTVGAHNAKTFDGSLYYAMKDGQMRAYTALTDMLGWNNNEYTIQSYPVTGSTTDKLAVEWDKALQMIESPVVKGSPSKDVGLPFSASTRFLRAEEAGQVEYKWEKVVKQEEQYQVEGAVVGASIVSADEHGKIVIPDFIPEAEGIYQLTATPINSSGRNGYTAFLRVVAENESSDGGLHNVYRQVRANVSQPILKAYVSYDDPNDYDRFSEDEIDPQTTGRTLYPTRGSADAQTLVFDGEYIWATQGQSRLLVPYETLQDLAQKSAAEGIEPIEIHHNWHWEDTGFTDGSGVIFSDGTYIYKLENGDEGEGVLDINETFSNTHHGVLEVHNSIYEINDVPSVKYTVTNPNMTLVHSVFYANNRYYLMSPNGLFSYENIPDLVSNHDNPDPLVDVSLQNRKAFFYHNSK